MATGLSIKLTGAVGEFLVAGELCRRGLLATPFAGNVPHYDIIASGQYGGHVAVQVKAINGPTWQFDIRKFLDAHMADDKNHQILGARQPEPFPDLMCVLVVLKGTGGPVFYSRMEGTAARPSDWLRGIYREEKGRASTQSGVFSHGSEHTER